MPPPLSLLRAAFLAAALAGPLAAPASAHEFWIEPESYRVAPGETVRADLRVGRMLIGEPFPYLSDQIVDARLHGPGGATAIEGLEGDLPALSVTPAEPGLHVLTYHSAPAYVDYDAFQTFVDYLAYEGLDDVARLHKERGLPESGFSEAYVRNARALLQVGPADPADIDRPTGMPLEIVALANPFAGAPDELPVQLLWQGAPLPNRQVSIFHRPAGGEGEVARSLVATDAEGRVAIPLEGEGFYLLNAVQMKPASGPGSVVWDSHWATLTFELGGS